MGTIKTGKRIYQNINIVNGDGVIVKTIDNDHSSSHYIPSTDSQGECIPDVVNDDEPSMLEIRIRNNTGRYMVIKEAALITQTQEKRFERRDIRLNSNEQMTLGYDVQIDEFNNFYLDCAVKLSNGSLDMKKFPGIRINYNYNGSLIFQVPLYDPNAMILECEGIRTPFTPKYQNNVLLIILI